MNRRISFSLKTFIAGLALALAQIAFVGTAVAQTTKPVIVVWHQQAGSMPTWKARGVNTMLGAEADTPAGVDAYCAAAKAQGLNLILGDNAESHWNDTNCIAVMVEPDEPNGVGQKTPGQTLDRIAYIREKTKRPVLIQLDGWQLLWKSDANLAAYCIGADWVSADQYPCNRGEADPLSTIPIMLARLKRCAPGKQRYFCCLETSDQRTGAQAWTTNPDASGTPPRPRCHAPSPLEVDAEARQADDAGADYIWFPDAFDLQGNWAGYDGTPLMVAAAMAKINARKLGK